MRILVAVKPRVYREVLALSLHHYRPDDEVLISPPEALDRETGRFSPHLVICSEGAAPDVLPGIMCRVEIMFSDGLDARISMDGRDTEAKDLGTQDLFAFVDRTEMMIPKEEAVD
jgi:hypothetical protein